MNQPCRLIVGAAALLAAIAVSKPVATGSGQEAQPLRPGDTVTRQISGDQVHEYRVEADANMFVRLAIDREGPPLLVQLVRPDGTQIHVYYPADGNAPPEISLVTGSADGFRVRIRLEDPRAPSGASYELRFAGISPATPEQRLSDRAKTLWDDARVTMQNGDSSEEEFRGAIAFLQQAQALYHEAGNLKGEANALLAMVYGHQRRGELNGSLDGLNAILNLWRSAGDRRAEADTLVLRATFAQELGNFQVMLDSAQQALALYRAIGDPEALATNGLPTLARAYQALNANELAARTWDEANAISKLTVRLEFAGERYKWAGLRELAIDRYEEAIAMARRNGNAPNAHRLMSHVAQIRAELGQRDQAQSYMNQILEFWRSRPGDPDLDTLIRLALASSLLGDRPQAVAYLDRAAAAPRPNVGFHRDLAEAYAKVGEKPKALASYLQALRFAPLHNDGMLGRLQAWAAALERDLGQLDEARAHIEAALPVFESLRNSISIADVRSDYFATIQRAYDVAVDVLMRLNEARPAEEFAAAALRTSERAHARGLFELLLEAGIGEAPAATVPESPSGVVGPAWALAAPLGLDEIQEQVLDADTILLEYFLGDERGYLWVVSREGLAAFTLPSRAEIESLAARVYDDLTARSQRPAGESPQARQRRIDKADAEYLIDSTRLSEMVLGPAASLLSNKRLIIVAHGALQYIPFAALPDPASAGPPAARPPLMLAHELVSVPSASVLAALRQATARRPPAPGALAVLGDPVFDAADARVQGARAAATPGSNASPPRSALVRSLDDVPLGEGGRIPRLLFSREEANAIAALVPDDRLLKVVDFAASKKAATDPKLGQYRVVHFATHGVLNSQNPALSGLVLSLVDERGNPTDGFLQLRDIYDLKLNADLVVLSACQTALGKDVRGEGLVGLTRGFMHAGAARVAASLWKVDDKATADLMSAFYRRMLQPRGLSPAASLRAAMTAIRGAARSRWHNPYYWAAFQLQGEWR